MSLQWQNGDAMQDVQQATAMLGRMIREDVWALQCCRSGAPEAAMPDIRQLKELTAILKDLAAVGKTLGEQFVPGELGGPGVVALPDMLPTPCQPPDHPEPLDPPGPQEPPTPAEPMA